MAVEDQSLWFSSSKEQSQETPLAPLALMEKPSDSTVKGHVKTGDTHHDHDVNSRIGRSAFNMFPTLQSPINKRALGQASRYMNANARKQKEQDIAGKGVMKSQVSSANGPYCGSKSRKTEAVDEAGTVAESTAPLSMDIPKAAAPLVSCEQPKEIYLPEFEEKDSEQLRTFIQTESVRKGTSIQQEYCLKTLRQYFTELAFKARRDRNIPHDYGCIMICGFCLSDTLPALNDFRSVSALKDHIMFMHSWEKYESTSACMTCDRSGFYSENFFHHIESCMLRWMEKRGPEDPIRSPVDYCMESLQISWR